MGFLAGLFAIGAAAVAFPILFHLIRRTPSGRTEFSSLMFLKPSPPRLSRRSRLDHYFLLFLRVLTILLVALAFMRPVVRDGRSLSDDQIFGRRVAILLDTSASMRRGDLWQMAKAEVDNVLASIAATDDVALFSFDEKLKSVLDFDSSLQVDRTQKAALIKSQLDELSPSWRHTDLGSALFQVADALQVANDVQNSDAALQIILISDFQKGAETSSLQSIDWPSTVQLDVRELQTQLAGNADIRLLQNLENDESDNVHRVRISSSPDSTIDQFRVSWHNSAIDPLPVYLTPGTSRVVRLPRPAKSSSDRIVLTGDQVEFDNQYFVVPPSRETVTIQYVGENGKKDEQGLYLFLSTALNTDPRRNFLIKSLLPDEPIEYDDETAPALIFVAGDVDEQNRKTIAEYLDSGGFLVVVLADRATTAATAPFIDAIANEESANAGGTKRDDFLLLGQIDFSHPLFVPFASPKYNDFTGIRFWNHQSVTVNPSSSERIIARFDNGDPAIWHVAHPSGTILVCASDWNPENSELARSTKFVPLIGGIVEMACPIPLANSFEIGGEVPLSSTTSGDRIIEKPSGSAVNIRTAASTFRDTDQPGIYRLRSDDGEYSFAVNLHPSESVVSPMTIEHLESMNVKVGNQPTRAQELSHLSALRDADLEGRQKIWKWLLAIALGVLILESWLAGRQRKAIPLSAGAA